MSSAEYLKQFVSDRLAAVAEEIFVVFHKSIVEFEEELERHRKLFYVAWKPVVKLRRTDLPQQQLFYKKALTVEDQPSLDQGRNSSVDQEETELPQIKEQQEELSISEFGLKQEPEDLKLSCAEGENNDSENPKVDWNPEEPLQESQVIIPVITSVVSEVNNDLLLYYGVSHRQEVKDDKCDNSNLTRHEQKGPNSNFNKSQTDEDQNVIVPKINMSFTDDRCFKKIRCKSKFKKHRKSHVGSNYHVGKTLEFFSHGATSQHKTLQITEKSYNCQDCGRNFSRSSNLKVHKRIHTGEKPFVCSACDKRFARKDQLIEHKRIHTGERPYVCQICNKSFSLKRTLIPHIQTHTGEKPHVCLTCGRRFARRASLTEHERTHTEERPHAF